MYPGSRDRTQDPSIGSPILKAPQGRISDNAGLIHTTRNGAPSSSSVQPKLILLQNFSKCSVCAPFLLNFPWTACSWIPLVWLCPPPLTMKWNCHHCNNQPSVALQVKCKNTLIALKMQHKILCNFSKFQKIDFCEILDIIGKILT